jgi:hypothetical protein
MDWIQNNWDLILGIVLPLMALITSVVRATPTPKDDEMWGKISSIIGRIFGLSTHQDAQGHAKWKLPGASAKPKTDAPK